MDDWKWVLNKTKNGQLSDSLLILNKKTIGWKGLSNYLKNGQQSDSLQLSKMKNYREQLETGKFYHIFNHAVSNRKLFKNDENFDFFLTKFKKYVSPIATTYAYCLIPNHFHFLLQINEKYSSGTTITNPSNHFKDLFSSYTQAYNKFNREKGSLFEPRFKRRLITSENDLRNTLLYIHLNPLKHNLTKLMNEWNYSSYNQILSNKESLVEREEVIKLFDDLENFTFVHKQQASLRNYDFGIEDLD